jgi:hypothetical protein
MSFFGLLMALSVSRLEHEGWRAFPGFTPLTFPLVPFASLSAVRPWFAVRVISPDGSLA